MRMHGALEAAATQQLIQTFIKQVSREMKRGSVLGEDTMTWKKRATSKQNHRERAAGRGGDDARGLDQHAIYSKIRRQPAQKYFIPSLNVQTLKTATRERENKMY